MIEKLKKLKEKNTFSSPYISPFGHGTFVNKNYFHEAHALKKQADYTFKKDKKLGMKIYLDSIFLYIRGSLDLDDNELIIKIWKDLIAYIASIKKILNNDEKMIRSLLNYIMFILKFHCMGLETMYKGNSEDFIENYKQLYMVFESSLLDEFVIVKVSELEEFVKKKIKFNI